MTNVVNDSLTSDISTFICNICCDTFNEEEKCILDCNPEHYFCKTCINDWYKESARKGFTNELYSCPICKKFGGYNVLKKSSSNNVYESFIKNINERCATHCLCRTDDLHNPYTESKFCRINLTLNKNYYYGGTVTFADNSKISLCKDHYKKFENGETLYHFFHQTIFKEEDDPEDSQEKSSIKSFDWEKRELMTVNNSKRCVAKTKLGHRCTRKYNTLYLHKVTKQPLFLCPTHEKKLINDNNIEKFQYVDYTTNYQLFIIT